ncbi:FtsX-like permease family protein, partial [Actinacidiphila glaucinigra]|uniref:FtsX-like permease family protein n=1 Tax=Actinacidiphila glaucinigra TaxID=235986 RepID=UPI0037B0700A
MTETRSARQSSWTAARLRAAPGGALALAALVLVTAFLAAALPRTVEAYEDTALRDTLRRASLSDRSVTATLDVSYSGVRVGGGSPFRASALARTEDAFRGVVRPPLALDTAQTVYGARNAVAAAATDPGLPRPTKERDPRATLVSQPGLAARSRLVAGRMPASTSGEREVEAALTARTAKVMGLRAGSSVRLMDTTGAGLTVRITGIVQPRSPGEAFWNAEQDLLAPTLVSVPGPPGEDPEHYWHFTALIGQDAAGVVLDLPEGARLYWHHPADVGALSARDVPALRDRLASLSGGPDSTRLRLTTGSPAITVDQDGLAELLGPFVRERAAAAPLVLIATVGVGTVAGTVLLMAGGLSATRRRTELRLLRARGSSLTGLCARLLTESAVVVVPCAAAGVLLALLLVPAERTAVSVLAGVLVAAVAVPALPLRAVVLARRTGPEQRDDLVQTRPSRRRTVAELTVAVVVTGAVVALRRRGTAEGGADLLTAAAPVLVAVIGALVLLRLYPLPLRLLSRPAARLRGTVLYLGLARAGRTPSATALPLVAVLVALAVTSFGGSVLTGVEDGRDRAATRAVGGDARIESLTTLPEGLDARVRRVHGVLGTSPVRIETGLSTTPAGTSYDLVVVDPARYAALVASTGIGAPFPAASLEGDGTGPLPAVVSPGLEGEFGTTTTTVQASAGATPVRTVAVRDVTPAVLGGDFVIISAEGLARTHPETARSPVQAATALYVTGPRVDGRALDAVAHTAASDLTATLRSRERASFTSSALQTGARRVYLAAVAAGAGYSALALLLSLMVHTPQRKALLSRLRTMGMTSRQRQWIAVLETLPQVLLGALGGILVSLATVPLLRQGVDLTALAFSAGEPVTGVSEAVLRTDPLSLLLPSASLVVLACVVLAVQAWLTGRRGEGTELRMGERS